MREHNVPINKGNYSMDTAEREARFEQFRGKGWEEEYRVYREAWVNLPRSQEVSDYPLLVDIELASVCNLKCPMCYTISSKFKQKVNAKLMDIELYKQLIDEISGHVPAIRLSLRGESFLHKKIIECIRYAKDNGIGEVSSLTNGARLTGQFLKDVIDAGIDWITISIDGIGETYEKIRKPIKFDEVLDHIKEIEAYKKEQGLHRPVIKVQGIWPAIRENPQAYYDTFAPHADLVAFNPLIDYLFNDTEIEYVDAFCCPQQYQRLVIGADGLVMMCSNDEENQHVIGDVNKQTIHEVWHGEQLQAVREMMKEPRGFMNNKVCRQCYLPRKTLEDETAVIDGRTVLIKNYVNRAQVIGN